MNTTSMRPHRLGISILIAGSMLFVSGCTGDNSSPSQTQTGKAVEAAQPATTGAATVDGQTATITLTDDAFDVTTVNAAPGVVTIRLKNNDENAARLAVRQDATTLAEGEPASGEQLSEITIPVEANATYEFYLAGRDDSRATGTINVVTG